MSACDALRSDALELYFYGELESAEEREFAGHLAGCAACREALEELALIRRALSARAAVAAPEGGDWSAFMARLDAAVRIEDGARSERVVSIDRYRPVSGSPPPRRFATYVATAAMLSLVAVPLAYLVHNLPKQEAVTVAEDAVTPAAPVAAAGAEPFPRAAFTRLSEQHFERSKLVVLGLASKDARQAREEDWEYERQLASSLLTDTQLYRLAAEGRGLTMLADVMADLELVLLQTTMAKTSDPEDLEQIQRLIAKRDLVTKMDVVGARGL